MVDWISVDPDTGEKDGTVTVKCLPNSSTSERQARITVTTRGGGRNSLLIVQKAGSGQTWSILITDATTAGLSVINETFSQFGYQWTIDAQDLPFRWRIQASEEYRKELDENLQQLGWMLPDVEYTWYRD